MTLWLPAKCTILKKQPKSYLVNADASKTQQFQFVKKEELQRSPFTWKLYFKVLKQPLFVSAHKVAVAKHSAIYQENNLWSFLEHPCLKTRRIDFLVSQEL